MTQPKRILYRGIPMIEGWPERSILLRTFCHTRLTGKLFPAFVAATNKTTGVRSNVLAMIAGFSKANFTCQVATSNNAQYVEANCSLVTALSMIERIANDQNDAEFSS